MEVKVDFLWKAPKAQEKKKSLDKDLKDKRLS